MAWASHWAPGAGAADLRATLHPLGGLWGHPSPVSRSHRRSGVPAARNHCGGASLAVRRTTASLTTRPFPFLLVLPLVVPVLVKRAFRCPRLACVRLHPRLFALVVLLT